MCGIFAYAGRQTDVSTAILTGLKLLEYRGYDSWGIAVKNKDKTVIKKKVGKIELSEDPRLQGVAGVGHTRWATHGGVNFANAHPHLDCTEDIIIVHNGIVENYHELIKKLQKPHKFVSKTDTEIVAHLIEEEYARSNDRKKAVLTSFKRLKGLNAIIVFFPKVGEIYAIKNSSPLIFGTDAKGESFYLSSDVIAFPKEVGKIYFLDDEVLFLFGKDSYSLFSLSGEKLTIKLAPFSQDQGGRELGNFTHYMEKEIHEQPKILSDFTKNKERDIQTLAQKVDKAFGSYLIGCGTAFYACLAGSYLFSTIAKRHINAAVGSEFSYLVDFLKKDSLVIPLSQSGETIDVISSIKHAKEKKSKIYAITNVHGSTLYRQADYQLLLSAGPEQAVVSTKAFTTKLAALLLTAYALKSNYKLGERYLLNAIAQIKKILNLKQIRQIAKILSRKDHVYVLGRGPSYPIALETALKLKESSYVHAEGFAGGELKHGVMALIEKDVPVIVFNQEDETYEDTLSSAYEVKARGAYVIGVSSKKNSIFDDFVEVEDCREATLIPYTVIGQLLGYHTAVHKGIDPDKPRNLAKSVTVK